MEEPQIREKVDDLLLAEVPASGRAVRRDPEVAKLFLVPLGVRPGGEQVVDRAEDLGAGAVVLSQREDPGCVLAPLPEHVHVRVPEAVDGLELVADEEDLLVVRALREEVDELALKAVRVLELVHHDRPEAPTLPLAHLGVFPEEVAGEKLEILEVERRLALLRGPIGALECPQQLLEQVAVARGQLVQRRLLDAPAGFLVSGSSLAARLELGEVEQALGQRPLLEKLERAGRGRARRLACFGLVHETARRLAQLFDPLGQARSRSELEDERAPSRAQGLVDAGQHPPEGTSAVSREQDRPFVLIVAEEFLKRGFERLALEDARLAFIKDAEPGIDPRRERMRFQQAQAEPMDGRDPRAVERAGEVAAAELAKTCADPAAKLAGRALGVRDDEERVHVQPALAHGLDEPLDEHRRLPGARSRRDEDDAGSVDCSDLLLAGCAHVNAHERLTRHIGYRSHQEGQPASPRGSCRTSPVRMRSTKPRACSTAPSIWPQNSSSSR